MQYPLGQVPKEEDDPEYDPAEIFSVLHPSQFTVVWLSFQSISRPPFLPLPSRDNKSIHRTCLFIYLFACCLAKPSFPVSVAQDEPRSFYIDFWRVSFALRKSPQCATTTNRWSAGSIRIFYRVSCSLWPRELSGKDRRIQNLMIYFYSPNPNISQPTTSEQLQEEVVGCAIEVVVGWLGNPESCGLALVTNSFWLGLPALLHIFNKHTNNSALIDM